MAQSGFTPISIYYSSTAGNTPTAGNLVAGELAINTADGKLFYKDSAGVVQVIAGKGGAGVAGGSNTQVQYNSSGSLAGSANFTFNGTTVTIANDASISGLTVGKGAASDATNTVVGNGALAANTTGSRSVAIGQNALAANTTGTRSVAVGFAALATNTTGEHNIAIGSTALNANTTGNYSVAMGRDTLASNTTGSNNTGLGYNALFSNTTASNNTAVGYQAGYSNQTGTRLTLLGRLAGYNSTSGYLTAIGANAGYAVTTGQDNTFVGDAAGQSTTTGNYNCAFGEGSLNSNTTASYNTAIGYQAGYNLAGTGNGNNTCLGYQAGYNLTTGSYNTYIGIAAQPSSASVVGEIVIHASGGSTGKGGNTGFINPNGGGVYQGNNSTLWSITSDQRLKKNIVDNNVGLEKITQIKVRNFEYRLPEEITELDQSNAINIKGVQLGPIAQELKEVLPDCVKTESTGVMSVDASNLTWYLVNAIKELKAEIDQLKGVK